MDIVGRKLRESKKFQEAIEIYNEAIGLKPYSNSIIVDLLCSRASANSKIGNIHDAIDDYSKVLTLSQDRIDVRLLRAQCYDYMDELDKCIEDFEFVLRTLKAKNDVKTTADVQSKLGKAKKKLNHKLAEQKNNNGNEQFKLPDYHLAEKSYTEAIELWPNNALFYGNRCVIMMMLGEFKRALQDAQYIVALDEKGAIGWLGYQHMIKCLLILGKYDDAGRALDKCIANIGIDSTICEYRNLYTQILIARENAFEDYRFKCYRSASIFS